MIILESKALTYMPGPNTALSINLKKNTLLKKYNAWEQDTLARLFTVTLKRMMKNQGR